MYVYVCIYIYIYTYIYIYIYIYIKVARREPEKGKVSELVDPRFSSLERELV